MAHQSVLTQQALGPIEPHILYPLSDFQARAGMGDTAMRNARRAGLVVRYAGQRAYVLGRDFIDYVARTGKDKKSGAAK